MQADVVLCSAPVMSVVRPSIALGILHAGLEARGHRVETRYLSLDFADEVGIDLNEDLAERTPAHLLIGDWIFTPEDRMGPPEHVARYEDTILALLSRRAIAGVSHVRDVLARPFVARSAARILDRRPKIVGFSTMFQQTMASLAVAEELKRLDPSVVIVFGGANCHGPMGATLLRHYGQIDYVFTGEADFSFPALVDGLLTGATGLDIAGCVGRGGGTSADSPVDRLDDTPVPQYRDYFTQLATLEEVDRIVPAIPFESSRGCWWGQKHHCTFCGLNAGGMAFRAKSSQRVLDEMDELEQRHGIRRFTATDNILSLRHAEEIMRPLATRMKDGAKRSIFYEIKANLNEATTQMLADAGVVQVQPGIESLSDEVLTIMNKGVDALLNVRLLRNCRELGMTVIWSLLHGFPGEPHEVYGVIADMLPSLEHLQPPRETWGLRLDRFSPNFEQADRLGYRDIRPMAAYYALYDVPEEDLHNLAYFFDGTAVGAAGEESLTAMRAAIREWRAPWVAGNAPRLRYTRVGSGMLVRDTRRIATDELHYLDAPAADLADRLRNPMRLTAAIDAVAETHPRDAVEAAARMMIERHLVLAIGDKALSLMVEGGQARVPIDADSAFGRVLAPEQMRQLEPQQ